MATLTPKQLHILQHSLGLDDYGRGSFYRNHYVAGPGHHSFDDCRALVASGLMTERLPTALTGGDSSFHVTEAGKVAVATQSPPPPKLSRSQQRYQRYLAARDALGITFRQWLMESL